MDVKGEDLEDVLATDDALAVLDNLFDTRETEVLSLEAEDGLNIDPTTECIVAGRNFIFGTLPFACFVSLSTNNKTLHE